MVRSSHYLYHVGSSNTLCPQHVYKDSQVQSTQKKQIAAGKHNGNWQNISRLWVNDTVCQPNSKYLLNNATQPSIRGIHLSDKKPSVQNDIEVSSYNLRSNYFNKGQ